MVPTPQLVPLPAHTDVLDIEGFTLTSATPVTGEPDAVAALRGILSSLGAPDPAGAPDDDAPSIALTVDGHGPAESYRLESSAAGITVAGADAAGLFYGVQTLAQLLSTDAWTVPAVRIDDAPRFAYRGVMLDIARHFHPVATIEAYIDRAASLKFNVLHLHLTDDQGWRLEIASHPTLTTRAAGSSVGGDPGGFLTADDYRHIIAYATARHMTVVPEIDLPGHTHAVSLAYPDLAEQPVLSEHIHEVARLYGGGLPEHGTTYTGMAVGFSSLKIHEEKSYVFLAEVLGELADLTPGPYLHIGGDEALGTSPEDYTAFVSRATRMVADLGKIPVAWHEAGSASDLAPGTIGQYWGFVNPTDGMDEKARAFVARGGRVILSPADAIYLDMKPSDDFPIGLTWARGATSPERAYAWEPADVISGLTEDDILGVEAPLWTETVRDLADIDALIFPRIGAAAEAAWSPRVGEHPDRVWASFRQRATGIARRFAAPSA